MEFKCKKCNSLDFLLKKYNQYFWVPVSKIKKVKINSTLECCDCSEEFFMFQVFKLTNGEEVYIDVLFQNEKEIMGAN